MPPESAEPKTPFQLAEEHYRAALKLGRRSNALNDRVTMIDGFRKALEFDPEGHAEVRGHLAWGYFCNSQFESAATEYLRILEKNPSDNDANYYGALSLIRARRGGEASGMLLKAGLSSFPSNRGWTALFLAFYYGIPLNRFLYGAYRWLVWVCGALLLWIKSLLTFRGRFGTGAYLFWAMRNWPDSFTPASYARSVENEFALTALDPPKGTVVLDIGTGPTPFIPFAATRGVRFIGSDPDAYIGEAREACPRIRDGSLDENLLLMRADGTRLPIPDESFHRVLSISTVEHIPDDGDMAAMREIARVLAPGGRAVVTTEGANEPSANWCVMPFHVGFLYDFGELDKMEEVEKGSSVGFYRNFDPVTLVDRLGTVPGLRLVESGFLVDRTLARKHFPDYPETLFQKILSPWKAILGNLSYRRIPNPFPASVDLTGAVGYVILEKPQIP